MKVLLFDKDSFSKEELDNLTDVELMELYADNYSNCTTAFYENERDFQYSYNNATTEPNSYIYFIEEFPL